MLYQLYETQRSLMEPFADFAQAAAKLYSNPLSPFGQNQLSQRISASYDLLHRLGKDYEKPAFGIKFKNANQPQMASAIGLADIDGDVVRAVSGWIVAAFAQPRPATS